MSDPCVVAFRPAAPDRQAFYTRLERNGPAAVAEFRRAEEIWRERGTRP